MNFDNFVNFKMPPFRIRKHIVLFALENVLISTLIILGAPLLCLVSIPFLMYRKLSQIVVKRLYKNTVEIVHPMGQMFAPDFFKPNPRYNIIFSAVIDGHLPFSDLKNRVQERLLDQKKSNINNGEFKFAQLHYTCAKRAGFYYWENNSKVPPKISDYLYEYKNSNSICTEKDLKKIMAGFITDGWKSGDRDGQQRPPIQMYLIHNYVGEPYPGKLKSVFILRTHHFVVDGCSLFNIVLSLLSGNLEHNVKPPMKSGGFNITKLFEFLPTLITLPSDYWDMFGNPSVDRNVWRRTEAQIQVRNQEVMMGQDLKNSHYTNWTSGIETQQLKQIKNSFGVNFQSVVMAVVAKAVQNLIVSSGKELPKKMKMVIPIPLPGHPEGLENYFGFITADLPVGELDQEKRLHLSYEQLQIAAKSLNALITYKIFILSGHFPEFLSKLIMNSDMGNTVDFSTFPGIQGPAFICGHHILEAFNLVGTGPQYTGATLTALTCFGKIKFTINIDSTIWTCEESLEKFDEFIKAEIHSLLQKSKLIDSHNNNVIDLIDDSVTFTSSKTNNVTKTLIKKLNSHKA